MIDPGRLVISLGRKRADCMEAIFSNVNEAINHSRVKHPVRHRSVHAVCTTEAGCSKLD